MDTRNRDSPVVYICSRYSGDVERNTELARQYSRLAVELWVCGPDVSEGMRREIDCAAEMKIPIRYIKEEEILCMRLPKA